MPTTFESIKEQLERVNCLNQVPEYAIPRLSNELEDNDKILCAMKMKSYNDLALMIVIAILILIILKSMPLLIVILITVVVVNILINTSIVMTDKAIYIFPINPLKKSYVIQAVDICKITVGRSSFSIFQKDDQIRRFYLIPLLDFNKKDLIQIENAIENIMSEK